MATNQNKRPALLSRMRAGSGQSNDKALATVLAPERSSVISDGVTITGDITTPGTLHINGKLVGDLQAKRVVIGQKGDVQGNVNAAEVALSGRLNGLVTTETLQILASGVIEGRIRCTRLEVDNGAAIFAEVQAAGQSTLPDQPRKK